MSLAEVIQQILARGTITSENEELLMLFVKRVRLNDAELEAFDRLLGAIWNRSVEVVTETGKPTARTTLFALDSASVTAGSQLLPEEQVLVGRADPTLPMWSDSLHLKEVAH
ncbi:hypothetical protein [Synechococcus sp. PCC 7336]|uniref:hypothetical protein n=1 Tax=Synechococcus sp. PCC 7336 TaxID=195250 RepID=UPI000346B1CC|nr:hypothetical protein [Synechococcus sp. PCC 7336]